MTWYGKYGSIIIDSEESKSITIEYSIGGNNMI
jgi:hypothetical protein